MATLPIRRTARRTPAEEELIIAAFRMTARCNFHDADASSGKPSVVPSEALTFHSDVSRSVGFNLGEALRLAATAEDALEIAKRYLRVFGRALPEDLRPAGVSEKTWIEWSHGSRGVTAAYQIDINESITLARATYQEFVEWAREEKVDSATG